ncbi:hypothetical protein ACSBR1_022740 [Camellia fascicularis]
MGVLGPKLKQASLLWLHGFRDACCLHRVLIYCFRSKRLPIRTGQCFLLNGLIFLGSIFIVNSVVIPTLQWILPDQCPHSGSQELCSSGGILKLYSFLRLGLLQLFYRTNHHRPSSQHRTRPVSINLPPSNIATAAHRPPLLLHLRDPRHPLVLGQLENPFPMAGSGCNGIGAWGFNSVLVCLFFFFFF